ncbi:MAG TPA: diguanylate cyclase [Capillimicrobium sp.]|nr:diguanylate cyclase [Capillimicrobium sp.]
MSFRARLTLFFVLIVIVPMLSVAIVLFRLISDNETGKADASVAARQRTAINLYADARRRADRAIGEVGTDEPLAMALRAGDQAAAERRARVLVARRALDRIVITDGAVTLDVGADDAIAPADRELVGRGSERFGRLQVSVELAGEYAGLVHRVTDADVVVRRGTRVLASTLPAAARDVEMPPPGEPRDLDAGGEDFRAVTFETAGFDGDRLLVTTLSPDASREDAIARSRLLAGGILLGFLVLAMTFAVAVSRSLQAQIGSFLEAARRIARGDFRTEVSTTGRDEFAALGAEFNSMSRQLEGRLEELRRERGRLQTSLRRIGQAFASNLDRDALLEIVVRTAVDGVEATGGRASARPAGERDLAEAARAGALGDELPVLREAEAAALAQGRPADAAAGDVHALAVPLQGAERDEPLGLLSVVRHGEPFGEQERELLTYLAAAAAVSMENVGLHEAVQRQAVTDELTGLYNHRRFQEALVGETERAKRFGQPMALVMIDIDNFKRVNDTYGHQTGDRVLREVARVLQERSREIDAPARYGGEELAVVLPQTDLDGAYHLAERVREGIAAIEVPLGAGREPLRVTASLGVASLPATADEPRELLAAADAALYEAKRSGKNKTVRALDRV